MDDYIRPRAIVCGPRMRDDLPRIRFVYSNRWGYSDEDTDRKIPVCNGCKDCNPFSLENRGLTFCDVDYMAGGLEVEYSPLKWPDDYGWVGQIPASGKF